MSLLLHLSFEEAEAEPEAEFVRARAGRSVVHGFGVPRDFAPKDPSEIDWINFDFSASLVAVADTIEARRVHLSAGDAALTLSAVASEGGIVSCRWAGGRRGVRYAATCRIDTEGGRRLELTGIVLCADS